MLSIKLHFPHDRFAIGWEIFYPDEEYNSTVIILFLTVVTLEFEFN